MHRYDAAIRIAQDAGEVAMEYYRKLDDLPVEVKGHQDFVTEADRDVELFIRGELEKTFPADGIVGEEFDDKPSESGFIWVIDPIDGTANFIKSIPAWTVVLAGVEGQNIELGVIRDPVLHETFAARRGEGATLNGRPLRCPNRALTEGAVGIGFSGRREAERTTSAIIAIIAAGGTFQRLAAGAISLAYVAAGRFVGYVEGHMNAWDCLAGQLIVAEAGGLIEKQDAQEMLAQGGRVVAGTQQTYEALERILTDSFGPK